MVVLVAICAGCGGTAADTPVNAAHHQRRMDPALAKARAAAAQAEMSLSWARSAIATRWLLQPESQEGLVRAAPHRVRSETTSALVKAGHRWASHRLADRPHADVAEWWAWAHDVHQAVRRTIRDLAHDGSQHPTSRHSLVHGSSWLASRAFAEYTRLCTRGAR